MWNSCSRRNRATDAELAVSSAPVRWPLPPLPLGAAMPEIFRRLGRRCCLYIQTVPEREFLSCCRFCQVIFFAMPGLEQFMHEIPGLRCKTLSATPCREMSVRASLAVNERSTSHASELVESPSRMYCVRLGAGCQNFLRFFRETTRRGALPQKTKPIGRFLALLRNRYVRSDHDGTRLHAGPPP